MKHILERNPRPNKRIGALRPEVCIVDPRLDINEVRLAHLRATAAAQKGWFHVAAQNYLYCLEAAQRYGNARATAFFATHLVNTYKQMGMEDKAKHYGTIA
jgi:hypothetical protein